MADDPQISVASLHYDLALMRQSGFWPAKVECGPLVYELLIEWCICGNRMESSDYWTEERILAREDVMRKELMLGLTDMKFNGMPVALCYDVPDYRLWPSREKDDTAPRAFPGSEAHAAAI